MGQLGRNKAIGNEIGFLAYDYARAVMGLAEKPDFSVLTQGVAMQQLLQ
jgi:hypothetical protein